MEQIGRPHNDSLSALIRRLERARPLRLFWVVVAFSIFATELIVSPMSLLFHGRVTPDYLVSGAVAGFIVSVIVVRVLLLLIQHLKRIGQALMDTKEALEQALITRDLAMKAANVGIWTGFLNPTMIDGEFTFHRWQWDREMNKQFGFPEDMPADIEKWMNSIHPDDHEHTCNALHEAILGHKPYNVEYRVLFPDGKLRHINAKGQVIFNDQGIPLRIDGITYDVTEKIEAQNELIKAKSAADAANQAKSEFLANMSHEIRTPLNSVLGLARIAMRESAGRSAEITCRRILEAGEHLLRLINDILDFSRLEADRLRLESLPFDLSSVLSDARDLVRGAARDKGLDWVLDGTPDVPLWVRGDPHRLRQILVNLLSNAVKFTERGEVRLRVARAGDEISFQVIDTGIGMSAEQIAELFQPFHQADSSTTRRFGGSGLGLTISQRLARLMGGEIRVESRPGAGSTFTLRLSLPATEAPIQTDLAHPASHTGGPRLTRLKVLAAEDLADNRLILEHMLHHEGAEVTFAEHGRHALDLLEARGGSPFDLVLMDVQMPVMDGYQATRAIREMVPGLPVIGLTAHALAEERERCLAAGMVDHVTKPIDPDLLVAAIRQHTTAGHLVEWKEPRTDTESALAAGTGAPGEQARSGLIDRPALLARYGGRLAFIKKLLATSRASHAEGPARLREAVQQGDLETVRFLAHGLKGLGGNLEVPSLRALAIETEQAVREGWDEVTGLALKLAGQLQQLLGEMEQVSGHETPLQ